MIETRYNEFGSREISVRFWRALAAEKERDGELELADNFRRFADEIENWD